MIARPWSSTRRPCAGLRNGAVAALILLAAVLPTQTVFANDTPRSPVAGVRPIPPRHAEIVGTLQILHEDREDGTSLHYRVLSADDGTLWSLDSVPRAHDLLTGDRVRVTGSWIEILDAAPVLNTFGSQKTILILVNFSNDRSQPYTAAQAKTGYAAVDSWFREVSYQQTSLVIDAIGWYTLPITNASCDIFVIQSRAREAAATAGVNLSTYVRQVYAFPFSSSCQFAGMGTVGGTPSAVWINGNTNTGILTHEFGHTLGLYHSHALNCHPTIVTPPCSIVEYGDTTDTMGGGTGHYNAFQKQRLGWLDYNVSPPITMVQNSGVYTIDAYEFTGTIPKALKIARGTTGQSFYVELRRNQGWDTNLYRSGVFLHMGTEGQADSSQLLDMTPATSPLADDAFLDVGKSFTDPVSGVTITTVSMSSSSATIRVDMDDAPCTRSAPNISATPAGSTNVDAKTAVMYSVSVTNTDSAGCSASTFTFKATPPTTSWGKSFAAPSVTLNAGATAPTTMQITSPTVAPGPYTVDVAATSTTNSTLSDSTSVLYNVGGNDPIDPASDDFNRPDSPTLDNGWLVVEGSLMIQSEEAVNEPGATFSLAVMPSVTGRKETVEATFASTDNNSAPRFAVIMRYLDPQNYYMCYRQVGGSSMVRIAKVQNGTETMLKSAGIANPPANALFTLSCGANGTSLTLGINGVTKLTVLDGTFTTGSVGFLISTKAGSHRADDFNATAE